MTKLSIIIITKNESKNIAGCINSARFADELIVVDSGSKDNTVDIARKLGAKVYTRVWSGYGRQKNIAAKLSSGEWIFSLDADERISKQLKHEILAILQSPKFFCYSVSRKSFFISRFLNYSGGKSDRVKRLFKKGTAYFSTHHVHEHLATDNETGKLKEPILHYSYMTVENILEKINLYSTLGSRDLKKSNIKSSLTIAILHGVWVFSKVYFFRLGFLDGREGFIHAFSKFEHTYYKYVKRIFN